MPKGSHVDFQLNIGYNRGEWVTEKRRGRTVEETFGQKMRALRRAAGVTQRELAKQVGVDFSYVSKLENDRLPPPAAETVIRICSALDEAPDELLAAGGKMPPRLQESISSNPAAIQFLRSAQAMGLDEAEWAQMQAYLHHLRSEGDPGEEVV